MATKRDLADILNRIVLFQTQGFYRAKLCRRRENEAGVWSALLDEAKEAIANV